MRKAAALVCVLTAVGVAGVLGDLFRYAGGHVPLKRTGHVTGNAVITHRTTAGLARDTSGHAAVPARADADGAPPERDRGLMDADDVTLRATMEAVITDFEVQEATVSPDVDNADDPEETTRLATLEPELTVPVD